MGRKIKNTADFLNRLPQLVAAQVIDAPAGERLRAYYGPSAARSEKAKLIIFCGILCSMLVGGGLTMIIAHNWSMFSPEMRISCGFVPLIASLLFGGWVLFRRKDAAWREPVAPFIAASLTGTIALVSQVYHSNGTLDQLLLVTLLFSVGLMIVFDSLSMATLFAIAVWPLFFLSGFWAREDALHLLKLLIAAGGAGYLAWRLRKTEQGYFVQILLANVVLAMMSASMSRDDHWGAILPLAVCGLLLWNLGSDTAPRRHLLRACGGALLLCAAAISVSAGGARIEFPKNMVPTCVLGGLLLLLALHTWFRNRSLDGFLPLAVPFLFFLGCISGNDLIVQWLGNVLMLGYGVFLLFYGARTSRTGMTNFGMGILSLYVVLRFFLASNDFLLNGLIFIGSGLTFGIGCYIICRFFRTNEHEEKAK